MKERNKEKENRKLIVVSIRPGAPPAGWPVHPEKTRRADAPGRRHEISEYKILNDVSLFIVYII